MNGRPWEGIMRFYLAFVGLALLMGSVCLLLGAHTQPPPGIAMIGLFGAQGGNGAVAPDAALRA
jgi:xanthosine utilization system XapX-like protein